MPSITEDFPTVIWSPHHGGWQGNIVALIFHDEEYPETVNAPFDVGNFFSRTATAASVTGIFGNIHKVGCVEYGQSAWHSGAGSPWNGMCEGYEHSGYAHQTTAEWLDPYGIDMLELSAAHYAKRCHDLGIPVRKISPEQLRHAIRTGNPADGGICGHWDISIAAYVRGGHYDPGGQFPWDYFIGRVQAHYDGTPGTVTPQVPDVVVHPGNVGVDPMMTNQTAAVQAALNEMGIPAGEVDGIFGPKTTGAVMEFQRRAKDVDGNPLVVDGIVGPKTWTSLNVCLYLFRSGQAVPVDSTPVLTEGPPWTPRIMFPGDEGADVSNLQRRLRDRGWNQEVDGQYGPHTTSNVKAFQSEKGLLPDGVTGPQTWTELWRNDNIT